MTGLVYQRVPCNEKDGLLIAITTRDPENTQYEIYVQKDGFPTTTNYVCYHREDSKPIGNGFSEVKLVLTKKDCKLPVEDGHCYIGARVIKNQSESNFLKKVIKVIIVIMSVHLSGTCKVNGITAHQPNHTLHETYPRVCFSVPKSYPSYDLAYEILANPYPAIKKVFGGWDMVGLLRNVCLGK